MTDKRKPKPGPNLDEHVASGADEPQSSGEEDDINALTEGWVGRFQKNWLNGEARAYALEHHVDEFCRRNAESADEGTAYSLIAIKDMIRVFGIFGPWGKTSTAREEDEEEDDGRAYDDVDDLEPSNKKSSHTEASAAIEETTQSNKGKSRAGNIQAREGELLKAAHLARFRKSFTNWLRYQYRDRGGETLRGRGKSKTGRPRATKKRNRSDEVEGEELSRLMIHELLGLGQSKLHVPHAFQLWAKDQPAKFRKRFLKDFAASGRPRRKRAGAEMAYNSRKFHECEDEVKETYRAKVQDLKEQAGEKRDSLREKMSTRLDPQDAAKVLEAMPYILDPLLTSLSMMLHAKVSLLIGVPEPTEGGVVTIKSFDKGENHDDIPASFGQTSHYARYIDSFKEFLNGAYTQSELRACAIPGTLPKSPKKGSVSTQRSDGKKVVIVVQNMALPPGDNWITRKARLEDDEDEEEGELTPIQIRRLRREKREAKARQLEEDGPPVKRPRGRPRKQRVRDADSEHEDSDEPRQAQKKAMPESKKRKRSKATTTTASGSTTLGDITTSRGKKKPEAKTSESRKKLLAMAASVVASSDTSSARVPSISPERSPSPPPRPRPQPRINRKQARVPSISPERSPSPPPRPRPQPRINRKQARVPSISPERAPSPPPRPRPQPRINRKQAIVEIPIVKPRPLNSADDNVRSLTPILEDDETRGNDLGPQMDTDEANFDEVTLTGSREVDADGDIVMNVPHFDLAIDEFELNISKPDDDEDIDDMFQSPPTKRRRTTPNNSPEVRRALTKPSPTPPAETRQRRIPPTGDHRIRKALPARKPPSTRAASVAPPVKPLNPFDEGSWSVWFRLCHAQFSCIKTPEWINLLNLWTRFEGLAAFEVGHVILGSQSNLRPPALGEWVNIRRRSAISVPKRQLKSFAAEFWAWWIDLQPEWRDVAGRDAPLTLEHREPANGRDWGPLSEAKGRNGLVSILACLAWWGVHHNANAGPAALRAQWGEAVGDVTYVFESLLE